MVVRPVADDFQLALDDEQVGIPRGGTALIPVTITRKGYRGPIALDVRGVRADVGITVLATTVPDGQTNGVVGLKAATDSAFPARDVQVVGKGKDGRTVAASKTIVFAQQTIVTPGFGMSGTIPSYARTFVSLTAAVTRPGPILLNPGTAKVVVPRGSTVEVPIRVVRTGKEKKAFQLAALSPPPGLSVAASPIGASATSVLVKVTAAPAAPLGPLMVALIAQDPGRAGAEAPPGRRQRHRGRRTTPADRHDHVRRRGGPTRASFTDKTAHTHTREVAPVNPVIWKSIVQKWAAPNAFSSNPHSSTVDQAQLSEFADGG